MDLILNDEKDLLYQVYFTVIGMMSSMQVAENMAFYH